MECLRIAPFFLPLLAACVPEGAESSRRDAQTEVNRATSTAMRATRSRDTDEQSALEVAQTNKTSVDGPRIQVLGIAQDGGLPHAGCHCSSCDAARSDPDRAHFVASLALLSPSLDGAVLIDATPDIHEQLDMVRDAKRNPDPHFDRNPVAGILLTHAHVGHYLGLAMFGFEVMSSKKIPVWASPRMQEYLRTNGPWSQLVELENIELRGANPGRSLEVAPDIRVEPIAVPHRDEFSDTLAFHIIGPKRHALYVPDTSPWSAWKHPLIDELDGVDVALLDATFYSGAELPGRDLSKIGHPLVTDTMDLLQPLVDDGLEVQLIHLNHSNPALDPKSDARKEILGRGFQIASEGLEIPL